MATNTNDLIYPVCLVYACGFLPLNILILMSISVILDWHLLALAVDVPATS